MRSNISTRRRRENEGHPSETEGWNFQTLDIYLSSRIAELEKLLLERYETQSKAIDAAKVAQETAMQTALTAAERAVSTARISDKEAVDKAELAADKRFSDFRAERVDAEGRTAQRISDLTSRLDLSQGQGDGEDRQMTETRGGNSQTMQAIAIILSFIAILVVVGMAMIG